MEKDDFDLIENLHKLSTEAVNIPLDKLKSHTICFYEDHYAFDDFLARDGFCYQDDLLKTPDRKINVILKNFDKAIATQCNNAKVDLSNLKLTDHFTFSTRINFDERASAKRYVLKEIYPTEVMLFKKYWLLHFISECRQIVWNIRDILGIPQPEFHKTTDVIKLLDETGQKEAVLKKQSIELFSSSKNRQEGMNKYYKNILPQSIENIDNLFYWLEKMQQSFADKVGCYVFEKENLEKIIANIKKTHLQRFESAYEKTLFDDKSLFLSEYQKAIKNLKLKKEIEGLTISKFTSLVQSKIDIIQQHPIPKIEIKNPLNKTNLNTKAKSTHQSFTYANNKSSQTQLTDLMNALKRKNLIKNSTSLKDFRKVFSGEEIEKPVIWTGNISELSYFIKQLHNELKLIEDLKQQQWAVTTICFIQENGKPFERSKFRGQKVPATSKNIDMVLKTLK